MADSPGIEADGISELLVDLENAAQIPTKQRAIKISGLVDTLCSRMYEDGLSNLALDKLVDIITLPHYLDQASVGSLIKNLYPASKVQDAIIIKVVGSLGHGSAKPSFAAQALFLKWLVMVYEVLENPRILSQLYGILFNLLDTIAIRPQLCHVLALITRRKHVRTFRIQALMEITRHAGNDPPLVGLMRVYKDFYPDFIVGDATHGRASVFTHPNTEWRQRLGEIQEQYFQRTQDGLRPEQRSFRITRRAINGWKRRKLSVLPDVHTSHAQESSITLEEIENVADFIQNLEKIELPNQLVAVIGDPLLQKLLQLKSSSTTLLRVDSWLLAFFEDKLQCSSIEAEKGILEMLAAVRDYTQHTKKVPDACLKYLNSMMESWNGVTGREVILDILAYTPITPFEELRQSLFQTLEDAILDGTAESMLTLLNFYTKLLQQWITTLLAESHLSGIDGLAISSLVIYINNLALSLLQTSPNVTTYSTILYFYETVAYLISHPDLTALRCITIPQEIFIYTLNFTFSLNVLSRLCGILALYKRGFELAMSSDEQPYPKDYVNRFNGFLMDICNCLWRGRAFNTSDVNALGCLLPQNSESSLSKYVSDINPHLALPSLFSLSYSPVLCLLAISYFREEEDAKDDEIDARHAGPVTQRSLVQLGKNGGLAMPWPDYRLGVLQYLEKKNIAGVGELMYNTMKHLMKNSKA